MGKIVAFVQCLNEQLYIREWVEYYLKLGIDDIYIMEEFGSNSHKDALEGLLDKVHIFRHEDVDIDEYPIIDVSQRRAFNWFIDNYFGKDDIDWCLFFDPDEFLEIKTGESLHEFLSHYKDETAVSIFMTYYGANGHYKREPGSVFELYCYPNNTYERKGRCCKSIVNFKYPNKYYFFDVHSFTGVVNIDGTTQIEDLKLEELKKGKEKAVLHHFYTKSLEDYVLRMCRGQSSGMAVKYFFSMFNPDMIIPDDIKKQLDNSVGQNYNKSIGIDNSKYPFDLNIIKYDKDFFNKIAQEITYDDVSALKAFVPILENIVKTNKPTLLLNNAAKPVENIEEICCGVLDVLDKAETSLVFSDNKIINSENLELEKDKLLRCITLSNVNTYGFIVLPKRAKKYLEEINKAVNIDKKYAPRFIRNLKCGHIISALEEYDRGKLLIQTTSLPFYNNLKHKPFSNNKFDAIIESRA